MKRTSLILVFLLALATAFAASQDSSDQSLHQQVQAKFSADPALKDVKVEVKSGMAHLTGSVPSNTDKTHAKDLAMSITGVTGVMDELTVDGQTPSANSAVTGSTAIGETQNNTAGSIAGNSNATSANSSAQTGTAPATTGSSGANTQSQTGASASSTTGSTGSSVGANTQSAPQSSTGDSTAPMGQTSTGSMTGSTGAGMSTLQMQIQTAIQNEPTLTGSAVHVNVSETTITLTGTVPSGKEKQTAKRIAQSYAGNRRVEDKITVSGSGSSMKNDTGTTPSSSTISETGSSATSANPSSTSNPNSATEPTTPSPNSNPDTTKHPNTPPENPKTAGDQATPR